MYQWDKAKPTELARSGVYRRNGVLCAGECAGTKQDVFKIVNGQLMEIVT